MKTRITPNITSTAQFPPLNQNIKNYLSNDMSDNRVAMKSLDFSSTNKITKPKNNKEKQVIKKATNNRT